LQECSSEKKIKKNVKKFIFENVFSYYFSEITGHFEISEKPGSGSRPSNSSEYLPIFSGPGYAICLRVVIPDH
jgi:hypothetical protein